METVEWNLKFENDEDDTSSDLIIDLEIAGLSISFIFDDGHMFSIQDYQDFADGKKIDLVFNQSNGFTGLTRTTEHVVFNNDTLMRHACVRVPIAKCGPLFTGLVSERRACNVPVPDLFRTIEGLTKVEFVEGRILAHHTPRNIRGQLVTAFSCLLTGIDNYHRQFLLDMSRGDVASVFGSQVSFASGVQAMGTILRSDGVHLFIGAEAKGPSDILPFALPLQMCSEMLIKISESL